MNAHGKQQEVNLLIENEILGKKISSVLYGLGYPKEAGIHEDRGEHVQLRIIGGVVPYRDIRLCNNPTITIDDKKMSCIQCKIFIEDSINAGKNCVMEDFSFTFQGTSIGKDYHYIGSSIMKIRVDDQVIIIGTAHSSFTKIM